MNTEREQGGKLIRREQIRQIIGEGMGVLRQGHGSLEKPFENALVVGFRATRVPVVQPPRFAVDYKGVQVGESVPGLTLFDRLVVDAEAGERLTQTEARPSGEVPSDHPPDAGVASRFARPSLKRFAL